MPTTFARALASRRRKRSGSCSPRPPRESSPTCVPSRLSRRRRERSSSSTRSRASAPSPARRMRGASTSSSPARRRRSCLRPGLGLAAVSEAALAATGSSPRFYFDWERTRKAQQTLDAPVTLPVSLVAGLDVALELLLEEGLEAAFDRHVRLGRAARAGVKALGLELFSPDEDRSAVVTAVRAPVRHRLRRRHPRRPRPLRDHDRQRPGRAEGEDLPPRPHRLVRRLRHHDADRGGRARPRRPRRRRRARRRRDGGARGVQQRTVAHVTHASSSARRSRMRASSFSARASTWTSTPRARSRRSSAATTRSSSARRPS